MANPLKQAGTATQTWMESSSAVPLRFGGNAILVIASGPTCSLCWTRTLSDAPAPADLGPETTLLASHLRRDVILNGTRGHTIIQDESLCSLLAFADLSLNPAQSHHGHRNEGVLLQTLPDGYSTGMVAIKNWIVHQNMANSLHPMLRHLRAREAYLITRHLLQVPELNVGALCRQYGLSYTHFRRLCAQVLEGGTKRKLRAWRAARSALQLIDGHQSLLDVALENGYASSSHICRDIKQLYGLTPSAIMKAHALLP